MNVLKAEENFLGITDPVLNDFESARFVIQQLPYEYTSSYHAGSARGPAAIIEASQFVEFYDEELEVETLRTAPVVTIAPLDFSNAVDADAVQLIETQTLKLLDSNKFVVSLGAEHTVTLGLVNAHLQRYPNLCVLQFDAHSDLRQSYNDNKYSHACVMARVYELGVKITQVGIRAQSIEEAELIKSSSSINTFYAHQLRKMDNWIDKVVDTLSENVYITIDADGFDPSVIPAVGTAEPGGMFWQETIDLLRAVTRQKNVVGFDVVEIAPFEGQSTSEFTLAKLVYKLMGYVTYQ